MFKSLICNNNVDSISIDGKYQDETNPLNLTKESIKYHQCTIKLTTLDDKDIEICFYSVDDLCDFAKAYGLK